MGTPQNPGSDKVRIDKWLWAARFYKTRSLCKQAIEAGKVQYNGQRTKTSKYVEVGAELKIRCGWDDKVVEVTALSDQRRGAAEASKLYRETEASIAKRAEQAAMRKAAGGFGQPATRPTRKQRGQIHRFKTGLDEP